MHIPQDELQKFQDGTMNTDEMIHFLEHMEQCDFCLDELLQNDRIGCESIFDLWDILFTAKALRKESVIGLNIIKL